MLSYIANPLHPAPAVVDVDDIIELVGHAAFERGRVCARDRAVTALAWDPEGNRLTGLVIGRAAHPYSVRIDLAEPVGGPRRTMTSICSCPMGFDCTHVAAALLASNAAHLQQLAFATASSNATVAPTSGAAGTRIRGVAPAQRPAWKSTLGPLAGIDDVGGAPPESAPGTSAPGQSPHGLSGTGQLQHRPGARPSPAPMGLQFELREATPRTRDRWRGPVSSSAGAVTDRHRNGYRLGVRPVLRNRKGNWVKDKLSWNTINYQMHRMNLDPEQHRWFCQFAPLHRAGGQVHFANDNDWLYLDDFSSSLLWHLFDEAAVLGIALLGTRKDTDVVVGKVAAVSLDASAGVISGRPAADDDGARPDLHLSTRFTIDDVPHPPESAGMIGTHGLYSCAQSPTMVITLAPVAEPLTAQQITLLDQSAAVAIPAAEVDEFFDAYYPRLRQAIAVTSSDGTVQFPEVPAPGLVLTVGYGPDDTLTLSWEWSYGTGTQAVRLGLYPQTGETACRDAAAEAQLLARAAEVLQAIYPDRPDADLMRDATLSGMDTVDFTRDTLPRLEDLDGVRVTVLGQRPEYRELTETPELKISTVESEHPDWFDLGIMITVAGRVIPFDNIFRALAKGERKLLLVDKTYLSLNRPQFDKLRTLIDEAKALQEWETDALKISRYQHGLWADFEDLAEETDEARSWRESVSGLRTLRAVEPAPLPVCVRAQLRPYQLEGFSWLAFLWDHGLGGVLADDMGLGKTLQALALICHAREGCRNRPGDQRPFLVVAPTSVVANWAIESARFAPDLRVAVVGDSQARSQRTLAKTAAGADVVVTSYALFRIDFNAYDRQDWAGLILDEAQFVKNRTTRAHQCAKSLRAPFKLAVTGTPMENNLMELWSLFSIVAPGLFPSARKFAEEYQRPIECAGDKDRLTRLRRRIRPLMLRRTKDAVAPELPAKQEQVLEVELGAKHRRIYQTHLQRERQKILGLLEDMDKNRMIVFRSLTLLRLMSLDASLVDDEYAGVPSAKLEALFEQLEDVVAEGHRALVFSQFTSFLKKAATRLEAEGIAYCYLDGSTRHRADAIAAFKSGAAPVFLISLKAGGFGLNLTEADYCFILDPWWNPATESQAVNRTHRIGQVRNVMVYRLVSKATIEEKVMALKEKKAALFSSVLDDDAVFSAKLTADDIRGLLNE